MKFELSPALMKSMMLLTAVVEARDPYTGGHLWRVAQFAELLGRTVGLDRDTLFLATIGGYLHDLGKISVPDAVLGKQGPLTDQEYAVIKTHPGVGVQLLAAHPLGGLVVDAVGYHHERPDGRGYPDALDEIPMVSRIIAIADTFDAMTSTRPYRKGMPVEKAVSLLTGEGGKQFDSALLGPFLQLGRDGKLDHIVGHSDFGREMASCAMCGPVVAVPRSVKDGDAIACRVCGGLYRMHGAGDAFALEFTGTVRPPADLTFVPDEEQIDEVCAGRDGEVPAALSIETPTWHARHGHA